MSTPLVVVARLKLTDRATHHAVHEFAIGDAARDDHQRGGHMRVRATHALRKVKPHSGSP